MSPPNGIEVKHFILNMFFVIHINDPSARPQIEIPWKKLQKALQETLQDALWETLSPEEQAEWEAKAKAEATGPDGKIIHGHLPWSEARYMALEHHQPFKRVWD